MAEQARPTYTKSIFDEIKLRLTGPMQENATRPPSLRVSVVKNNPRIDVFTNIANDTDYGKIPAPMEGITMYALLEALNKHIDGGPDQHTMIENKVGMPGEQRTLTTTVLGKDIEGRVFISVIAEGRPKIKFVFLPSAWHSFSHKDGTAYGEAELSCLCAKGWVNMVSNLMANVMNTHYVPYDPQQNQAMSAPQASVANSIIGQSAQFDQELPY